MAAEPAVKKQDRPHWTTFIAPVCSVLVAIMSVLTTVWIFRITHEINRATLRPFVSIAFVQTTTAEPMRVADSGFTGEAVLSGIVRVNNSGKSPAYDVQFVLKDNQFSCVSQPLFTLAAGESKAFRTACMTAAGYVPNLTALTIKFLKGKISYRDGFGEQYSEDATFQLRLGRPLNAPFFTLNADPQP